jgi:hypothetical protein
VLRLGILRVNQNNTFALGYLVFERVYNGFGAAPTNSWQSDDIISNNYKLWANCFAGVWRPECQHQQCAQDHSRMGECCQQCRRHPLCHLCQCRDRLWVERNLQGAVDNITFGFNGAYTTYNFEVVPEPASMAALGSGLIGLLGLRRRKK